MIKKNRSIDRGKAYSIGLILIIIISVVIPYLLVPYFPQFFYFRAWEYVSEVMNQGPDAPHKWEGFEYGDMSRNYSYTRNYQDRYYSVVTVNPEDGFRIVPIITDKYPVVVLGDSHTWGAELSDNETLPWKLAKKINIPVFNGGRGPYHEIMEYSKIQNASVVIEVVDSFHLNVDSCFPKNFSFPNRTNDHYSISNPTPIPLKRISLFSKFLMILKGIKFDLENPNFEEQKYMLPKDYHFTSKYSSSDFYNISEIIINISEEYKRHNITYVVVPIPRRDLIYSASSDPFSFNFITNMSDYLHDRDVYMIDLTPEFWNHRNDSLFMNTDTHWSPNGTEIASNIIADYLIQNELLPNFTNVDLPKD